ncbi:polysaccharide biosynthesis protein [Tissierella sp. Yu-01]|uniref:putative polysaccharide biosynthesis protein n=1 Tax=Tissierella sp. Yu-01 TaxID=3035694 RepID=UPI00240D8706|nr:polysaccharide biosynthesis protein [Tissierella sp. Yu-01]WFA07737.1 polysaccharide biosynthesis protein [Tissierella sp. Yu-01]
MSKDNNFLKGAAILGIAGIIVKILGAIYRIPLSNIIKPEGMGYYQTAYPFYNLLLTFSTAGFPVAIAKLVSEKRATGDYRSAHKVFKVALTGLSIGGILTSLFLLISAKSIVENIGNSNAYYALIALVPALLFVPIMSAFRGFFQGRKTMAPTAISQVVEQLFRVAIGLGLTMFLLRYGIPVAAGGASFGGSIGGMAGALTILYVYIKNRKTIITEINQSTIHKEYPVSRIVRDLLVIAIPITIGAAIAPIMDTIDAALVLRRLQTIGFSEKIANDLYGQLKGMAQTLINLPQVFSIAISMSMVPSISDAFARKNKNEIKELISSGVRITLLIGLPCAFGLFVLSTPIIELLYFNNTLETIKSTGEILAYLSFGVIFLTLVQTLTAILQGLGKPFIPVRNLALGAIVKVILTYTLTAIPSINVKGAAISTVAAYAIASTFDFISAIKITRVKVNYKNVILKPLISAVGMAIFTRVGYIILNGLIGSKLSTLVSICIGIITYVILLIITGSITEEDFNIIPKGDKLAAKLNRFKIFK